MTAPAGNPTGTALITGAAHGIGAAFAQLLATRHERLVLVDKDEAALESMPESLARAGPAHVSTLAVDLSQPEDQDRVVERIQQEEELTLLINNAGFGAPGLFHKHDPQVLLDMLQVHVLATVRFCRAALPGMTDAGRGDIINVSSMAAELPLAQNVMYGSTKGFLRTFSEILRVECRPRGVNVQVLNPGYTRTEFHSTPAYEGRNIASIPDYLWLSPEAVAATSLRALPKRKAVCVPGFRNKCMYTFLRSRLVPKPVIYWFLPRK